VPLIAAIDLPIDSSGNYVMRIAIDGVPHGEVKLNVRTGAQAMGGKLVS